MPASSPQSSALAPLLAHVLAVYPDPCAPSLSAVVAPLLNASTSQPLLAPLTAVWGVRLVDCGGGAVDESVGWQVWVQVSVVSALLLIVLVALAVCVWKTQSRGGAGGRRGGR